MVNGNALSKELRQCDELIQELNGGVLLLEEAMPPLTLSRRVETEAQMEESNVLWQ